MRAKRAASLIIAALLLIPLLLWAFSYHTAEFKGGLGIRDSGIFSYPRFKAGLGEISLSKEGEYKFTVRGLPPGPLDLVLEVLRANESERPILTSLSTSVDLSLSDDSGKIICRASGKLSDAASKHEGGWVLASSQSHAAFWNSNCLNLPISRFRTYTLNVHVSDPEGRWPNKTLVAVLRGGGIELP